VALAISDWRRSAGSLCTTPPGTRWLLTGPRVTRHQVETPRPALTLQPLIINSPFPTNMETPVFACAPIYFASGPIP
jgi:hypothetical protein